MKCSIPKCKRSATHHHFPVTRSNGGNITVPICRYHHNLADRYDEEVVEALLNKAPSYWMKTKIWNRAQGPYFEFLGEWRVKHPQKVMQDEVYD
jgi:hypothetical protein